MTEDNIPHQEQEFHKWIGPFAAGVASNAPGWKLDPDLVTALTGSVGIWSTAYPAHTTAHRGAIAAAKTKDQAYNAVVAIARPLIQSLQTNALVTDTQRKQLKINVRRTSRTPVGVPTTAPTPIANTNQRLRHVISYQDLTWSGRGKPPYASYCQIWAKIGGPAPLDETQLVLLGSPTKSPYVQNFPATQAGLTVWYWLRWVNSRGEFGPWSVQVSATIPG